MGHKITISATGGDFVVIIRGRRSALSAGPATLHIMAKNTTSAAIVGSEYTRVTRYTIVGWLGAEHLDRVDLRA